MQTIQLVQSSTGTQAVQMQAAPQIMTTQQTTQPTVLQIGGTQFQQPQQQAGGLQIVQQVVGPDGQIQQIPIQLSAQQLQMLRMQLQANQATPQTAQAPLIIQTSPVQQATTATVMTTNQNGTQIIQST